MTSSTTRTVPSSRVAAWLTLDGRSAAESRSIARAVEELRYGALWIPETPTSKEAFTHASLLLAATTTLSIGTGIANVWARDPTAAAAARHALADAYPGRCTVGLGTSHAVRNAARGHTSAKPLTFMRDYLAAMAEAGPFVPALRHAAPLVLAALGPRMQELARDHADGIHTFFVTPEHTRQARERLGSGPLLVPQQAFIIGNRDDPADREKARAYVASRLALPNYFNLARSLGFEEHDLADGGADVVVDALVVIGSAHDVAHRLGAHLTAGASQVAAHPLVEGADGGAQQLGQLAGVLIDGVDRSPPPEDPASATTISRTTGD